MVSRILWQLTDTAVLTVVRHPITPQRLQSSACVDHSGFDQIVVALCGKRVARKELMWRITVSRRQDWRHGNNANLRSSASRISRWCWEKKWQTKETSEKERGQWLAPGALCLLLSLFLCLHSHSNPLMGFLQFLSLSVVFPPSAWSDMENLYALLNFINLSGLHVLSFFFLPSPLCRLSLSRTYSAWNLLGVFSSSFWIFEQWPHFFSLPSSLLLLDKCILWSMCTLRDDSRLDRWVWPLRAQRVTVELRCWKDFLGGGE